MKRKEFITLLGVGAGTVVVASCLGGCSKGGDGPAPDPNPDPTVPVLTINTVSTNVDLNNPNKGYIIQSGIIVAKNGANYIALSGICTHQQNPITYDKTNNVFPCPSHGSVFNSDGTVNTGPANVALKKYTTTYDPATDTLKVFA